MKRTDKSKIENKTEHVEDSFSGYSHVVALILQNELALHRRYEFSPKQRTEDFWKQICLPGNR